jgi:hypothetical protein
MESIRRAAFTTGLALLALGVWPTATLLAPMVILLVAFPSPEASSSVGASAARTF